ncbi:MAG: ATP-binding protein [Actinomycetota bacterium]|nr:ATP-binding protein [Actinomycetota bacterium]
MNETLSIAISALLAVACLVLLARLRALARATEESRDGLSSRLSNQLSDVERERRRSVELLEKMDEGVLVLNDTLTPVMANGAARRLLGFDNPAPAHVGSDEILSLARRAMVESRHVEEALQLWPQRVTVRVRAIPLEDQGGVAVVLQDVTEELGTQRIRRQFVANASHELKSPVAGMQALSEAIRDAVHDDPSMAERFSEKLIGEAERLGRLISDLLDLSRLEDPANVSRRSTNLSRVAQEQIEQVQPAASTKEMQFEYHIDSDVWVQGDHQQLGLMIRNLLDNAIRYTPERGTVTLSVSGHRDDAVLSVSDTGMGIPLKAQARVFERFYRVDKDRSRDRGGTGLGLSIVKHVVELHGGHVSLDSELGEGSTFTVRLPSGTPERRAMRSVAS